MTKGEFLTVRWNNYLTLGLGLPTLLFPLVVFSTSIFSDKTGFIGLVVIGVLY